MIIKKQYLEQLKNSFRLNVYEIKIWTALLSRGIATAGELADISSVPRSRSYDVLESLEKKGFIIMKIGKPIKYIAVQPEEIIDRVKKEISENAKNEVSIINNIKDTDVFRELELLHKSGAGYLDTSEISNSIVGRNSIYAFMRTMLDSAKDNVVIATTSAGIRRKAKALKTILPKLEKRDIKVRLIAPQNSERMKFSNIEYINKEVTSRFLMVDNRECLLLLTDENVEPSYETAVWIKSNYFSNMLNELLVNY